MKISKLRVASLLLAILLVLPNFVVKKVEAAEEIPALEIEDTAVNQLERLKLWYETALDLTLDPNYMVSVEVGRLINEAYDYVEEGKESTPEILKDLADRLRDAVQNIELVPEEEEAVEEIPALEIEDTAVNQLERLKLWYETALDLTLDPNYMVSVEVGRLINEAYDYIEEGKESTPETLKDLADRLRDAVQNIELAPEEPEVEEEYNANVWVQYVDQEGNLLPGTLPVAVVSQGLVGQEYNTIPFRHDTIEVNGKVYEFFGTQDGGAPEIGTTVTGDIKVNYVYVERVEEEPEVGVQNVNVFVQYNEVDPETGLFRQIPGTIRVAVLSQPTLPEDGSNVEYNTIPFRHDSLEVNGKVYEFFGVADGNKEIAEIERTVEGDIVVNYLYTEKVEDTEQHPNLFIDEIGNRIFEENAEVIIPIFVRDKEGNKAKVELAVEGLPEGLELVDEKITGTLSDINWSENETERDFEIIVKATSNGLEAEEIFTLTVVKKSVEETPEVETETETEAEVETEVETSTKKESGMTNPETGVAGVAVYGAMTLISSAAYIYSKKRKK